MPLASMVPARSKEWTCCCGMHIRTATIMIGLWNLFFNVLTLGILASVVRTPDRSLDSFESDYDDFSHMKEALPTPLSKVESPYPYGDQSMRGSRDDLDGLRCACMIAATLFLIHGATKYKPSFLVPFLCAQILDFAATAARTLNNLYYLSWMTSMAADEQQPAWRSGICKAHPELVSVLLLVVLVSIVLIKAYAIGIIWRCYKYLTMRRNVMLPYVIPVISARRERDYNNFLPDYEEALAQSLKQPPPPYYQEAILSSPMANANHLTTAGTAATSNCDTINGGPNDSQRLSSNVVTHVTFVDKHANRTNN